jgi:non-ribosomal peptide synthetase component F
MSSIQVVRAFYEALVSLFYHFLTALSHISGTTGKPKGVVLEHAQLSVFVQLGTPCMAAELVCGSRFLLSSALTFDVSCGIMYPTLSCGAALVLAPKSKILDELEEVINSTGVTHLYVTPSLFDLVVDRDLPTVRSIALGGERVRQHQVDMWRNKVPHFINAYGPTETTICCTAIELKSDVVHNDAAVIGYPFPNTTYYVLDSRMQPVPIGVTGELYLGGAQVARGYLGRPDLTGKVFIRNPFNPTGGRIYKTGDMCKLLPDGAIWFLGRRDGQVKVRGHRVELGEVENALRASNTGVSQAVVIAEGDSLIGFICPADVDAVATKSAAAKQLPPYMVPGVVIAVDSIPMNMSGKADTRALKSLLQSSRAMIPGEGAVPGSGTAPATPVEEAVLSIYREEIGSQTLGVTSDFFESGGDSLKAVRIVARLRTLQEQRPDLGIRDGFSGLSVTDLFQNASVRSLVEARAGPLYLVEASSGGRNISPRPADMALIAPASFQQTAMFAVEQVSTDKSNYNEPILLVFEGNFSIEIMRKALSALWQRHQVFRTGLIQQTDGTDRGQIVQEITPADAPGGTVPLEVWSASDGSNYAEIFDNVVDHVFNPFDMSKQLIRALVLQVEQLNDEKKFLFVLTLHHAIGDGWSNAIIVRDLLESYALAADLGVEVPERPLEIEYADYAYWQKSYLEEGGHLQQQVEYWSNQLAGAPSSLDLPTDRARPAVASMRGAIMETAISGVLISKLHNLCSQHRCSLFVGLLAVFQLTLSRLAGNITDVLVGTPNSGREDARLHNMVGCLMDVLVLRGDLKGNPSFSDLLDRLRLTVNDALRHSDVPFRHILDALRLPRDPSRNPMYQAMLNLKDARDVFDLTQADVPGVRISRDVDLMLEDAGLSSGSSLHELLEGKVSSKLDLSLNLLRPADPAALESKGVEGVLEFNTDLFDKETAGMILSTFSNLLESAVAEPSKTVWDLPLLTAEERNQMLVKWNNTAKPLPKPGRLLHELFLDQVELTPDGIALLEYGGDKRSMAYRELKSMADKVAKKLRALGVGADETVGLLMTNETAEAIAGVMGVLMAGGAYVPLDPGYPHERISLIEKDAGFKAVLVRDGDILQNLQGVVGCPLINVLDVVTSQDLGSSSESEDSGWRAPSPNSACYVIYTSGACVL